MKRDTSSKPEKLYELSWKTSQCSTRLSGEILIALSTPSRLAPYIEIHLVDTITIIQLPSKVSYPLQLLIRLYNRILFLIFVYQMHFNFTLSSPISVHYSYLCTTRVIQPKISYKSIMEKFRQIYMIEIKRISSQNPEINSDSRKPRTHCTLTDIFYISGSRQDSEMAADFSSICVTDLWRNVITDVYSLPQLVPDALEKNKILNELQCNLNNYVLTSKYSWLAQE